MQTSSRTRLSAAGRSLAAAAVLLIALVPGCRDDLQPIRGLLALHVQAPSAGLEAGTRIWLDGTLVVDSLAAPEVEFQVDQGEHLVRVAIERECMTITPSETAVRVAAGERSVVDLSIVALSGILSVQSVPSGLDLILDGEPRGTTPATITCLDGRHEVKVVPRSLGFDLHGDSVRTVEVRTGETTEASFPFSVVALPQSRGVMLELFTATYCPYCPLADHTVDALERDASYGSEAFSGIELHLPWNDTDPFRTDQIWDYRVSYYYGGGTITAPIAYFNGMGMESGSSGDVDGIYRSKIANVGRYGEPAVAAIYWTNVREVAGAIRGDLRFIAIEDLAIYARPKLWAFYAKDSLTADPDPFHVGLFNGVAREYMEPIDLRALGRTAAGSHLDVSVAFDPTRDAAFPSRSLKLVAFVQDSTTKEILQVREARIRLP